MSVPAANPLEERTEAVIISGPRRGQIVELPSQEPQLTAEEEALLDAAVASALRIAAMVKDMSAQAQALAKDLREWREREGV